MSDDSDVAKARQLVRNVILAQSNVFIKELLLKRDIKGGTNKAEFQQQLDDAITAGVLSYAELRDWVNDTEGWGDEHVYLYQAPKPVDTLLGDQSRLRNQVRKAGLESVFGADSSLEFPEERKLTGIHLADGELTFVWHQGTRSERRASDKDFDDIDAGGERYFYRAYREVSRRSVTRVVVRPKLIAVFLPSASEPKAHLEERASLAGEIEKIVAFADWELFSMSNAIKSLDAASMRNGARRFAHAHTTRFAANGGGHIEFASDTDQSYADVESLREVRIAVSPGKFKGTDGDFRFVLPATTNGSASGNGAADGRAVKVQLYAAYDRIRMFAKLTRAEAWWIIDKIPKRRG